MEGTDTAEVKSQRTKGIENFDEVLIDMLDAIGKGISIMELAWTVEDGRNVIEDIEYVHPKKLVWDSTTDELKVCTREYPSGVELPENKFVVHKYKAKSGHASRAGIMRVGNMKAAYEEHGGGIKGVAAAAVEGVKGYYTAGFTFIDNLTGGKLTNIKNQFSEKMSGVANAVSSGMLAAKNYASTQLSNMQAAYQSSGGGIKGIVAATMTGVQGTFSTAYSVINNLTGGKLESIRSTISNKIQAAKDTVSSVLDSIKSAFSSKLEAARSVVSSTIEKIKGVFNFSWKLPDLKLPHISVNGGQAPYGIGGKGSLPSFSIQWYKEGGILNGATIFGAMGGNLLGGGEAGAEAVLPLSELWKQMTEIVKGVVKGENEESGDTVQQTGANITSALTSKAASVRKEKESKTTTTKETYTSERWGKEGGTTIHQISFTVDISKIKDLPLLYKLIDELKDAQNRTDSPTPATT